MTGPEHYAKAERILWDAADLNTVRTLEQLRKLIETAQVHAVLALAAAIVEAGNLNGFSAQSGKPLPWQLTIWGVEE